MLRVGSCSWPSPALKRAERAMNRRQVGGVIGVRRGFATLGGVLGLCLGFSV